jgi:hypothetical protein
MRSLARNTASLVLRNPILWLPVLLADAASFCLKRCGNLLDHQLTNLLLPWLTATHSALSGATEHITPTPFVLFKLSLFTAPLAFAILFVGFNFYAAAIVATGALLAFLTRQTRASLSAVVSSVASSFHRILVYAWKLLILSMLAVFLLAPLEALVLMLQNLIEKMTSTPLKSQLALEKLDLPNLLCTALVALLAAWIMAPITLKLLQPPDSTPNACQKLRARISALIAVAAWFALDRIVSGLEMQLFQQPHPLSHPVILAIRAIASLITALPAIPFYIALYLIAGESPSAPADTLAAP